MDEIPVQQTPSQRVDPDPQILAQLIGTHARRRNAPRHITSDLLLPHATFVVVLSAHEASDLHRRHGRSAVVVMENLVNAKSALSGTSVVWCCAVAGHIQRP